MRLTSSSIKKSKFQNKQRQPAGDQDDVHSLDDSMSSIQKVEGDNEYSESEEQKVRSSELTISLQEGFSLPRKHEKEMSINTNSCNLEEHQETQVKDQSCKLSEEEMSGQLNHQDQTEQTEEEQDHPEEVSLEVEKSEAVEWVSRSIEKMQEAAPSPSSKPESGNQSKYSFVQNTSHQQDDDSDYLHPQRLQENEKSEEDKEESLLPEEQQEIEEIVKPCEEEQNCEKEDENWKQVHKSSEKEKEKSQNIEEKIEVQSEKSEQMSEKSEQMSEKSEQMSEKIEQKSEKSNYMTVNSEKNSSQNEEVEITTQGIQEVSPIQVPTSAEKQHSPMSTPRSDHKEIQEHHQQQLHEQRVEVELSEQSMKPEEVTSRDNNNYSNNCPLQLQESRINDVTPFQQAISGNQSPLPQFTTLELSNVSPKKKQKEPPKYSKKMPQIRKSRKIPLPKSPRSGKGSLIQQFILEEKQPQVKKDSSRKEEPVDPTHWSKIEAQNSWFGSDTSSQNQHKRRSYRNQGTYSGNAMRDRVTLSPPPLLPSQLVDI